MGGGGEGRGNSGEGRGNSGATMTLEVMDEANLAARKEASVGLAAKSARRLR